MGTIGKDKVSLDLVNTMNYGYVGEFHIGSGSPQKIRAMFDTGSANSWIMSKQALDSKPDFLKEGHSAFNKDDSPTWIEPADDDK